MSTTPGNTKVVHILKTPGGKRRLKLSPLMLVLIFSLFLNVVLVFDAFESEKSEEAISRALNQCRIKYMDQETDLQELKQKHWLLNAEFASLQNQAKIIKKKAPTVSQSTTTNATVEAPANVWNIANKTEESQRDSNNQELKKWMTNISNFLKKSVEAVKTGAEKVVYTAQEQWKKVNMTKVKESLDQNWEVFNEKFRKWHSDFNNSNKNFQKKNATSSNPPPSQKAAEKKNDSNGSLKGFFTKTFATVSNGAQAAFDSVKKVFKPKTEQQQQPQTIYKRKI